MGRPRQSKEAKTKYISLRVEPKLYERINAAIIREQSITGKRSTMTEVVTRVLEGYAERHELKK